MYKAKACMFHPQGLMAVVDWCLLLHWATIRVKEWGVYLCMLVGAD